MVVEVLSPSTERLDHTRKRWAHATIPSLRHYLLVGQDERVVEIASWQGIVPKTTDWRDLGGGTPKARKAS